MGFDTNAEAYKIFAQIEVGIREFSIKNITESGIRQWIANFLGNTQKESIKEIGKRIFAAQEAQKIPSISDIYLLKISKAAKYRFEQNSLRLKHPFYYLNWPDLDSLITKDPTRAILEKTLGQVKKMLLVNILKSLNDLRNDIAHSRFIQNSDLIFLQSCYTQILGLIDDFPIYASNQSEEQSVENQFYQLINYLTFFDGNEIVSILQIEKTLDQCSECLDSFWVNSLFPKLILDLDHLFKILTDYKNHRNSPGGLLAIYNWNENNRIFIQQLKIKLNDRKI